VSVAMQIIRLAELMCDEPWYFNSSSKTWVNNFRNICFANSWIPES
jgi:hypothetical protein